MANIISSVGGSLKGFGWATIGNVLLILMIFMIVLVVIGGVLFFLWFRSFNIRVKIFEPMGQVIEADVQDIKNLDTAEERIQKIKDKNIRFDNINVRKTKGKYIKDKTKTFFKTLMPLRNHEPVPMEYTYEDGINFMKLSKDVFIPIPKPKTSVVVGENTSISVSNDNRWRVWSAMMSEQVNNKYQDIDIQKKVTLYIVTGIVAMTLLGGFLLWLIYSSSNRGFEALDNFKKATDNILGSGGPK